MDMDEERTVLTRTRPNILVTGTPGVGKSTLCKLIGEYVPELKYVCVGKLKRRFHF